MGGRHKDRCCPTQTRYSWPLDVGSPWVGHRDWQYGGCSSMEAPDPWAVATLGESTDNGQWLVLEP